MTLRLKHRAVRNDGGVWGDDPDGVRDTVVLRSTDQTLEGGWRISNPAIRAIDPREASKSRLKAGDILITKSSGSEQHIGKASLVDEDVAELSAVFSNFNQRIRLVRGQCPRFYWYYMNSPLARHHYVVSSTSTSGLGNLSAHIIGELPISDVDFSTQKRIANFLDRETARIDQLIEKKQRLVLVLEEKRSSTTARAVTKGLDRNVPMRASGLPWSVEIPSQWDVYPLKRLARLKSGDSITSDDIEDTGDFPVFGGNGLRGYTSTYSHDGTHVLIGRQGALCGNINYASGKFFASEHAIVVTPVRQVEITWLAELLRTMNLNQYSMSAAQPGLSVGTISNLLIPVPPLSEQHAIADYIARETSRMDAVMFKISESIETLREFRSALITATVTGQIDVDTWRRRGDTDRRLEAIEEEASV